jgi:hypothetical protein
MLKYRQGNNTSARTVNTTCHWVNVVQLQLQIINREVQDKQIETVSYGEEKATPGEACRQRSPR